MSADEEEEVKTPQPEIGSVNHCSTVLHVCVLAGTKYLPITGKWRFLRLATPAAPNFHRETQTSNMKRDLGREGGICVSGTSVAVVME